MKRNIIIMSIVALMSLWFPTFATAQYDGTHGADFSGEDWEGDIDLGFDFDNDENTTGVKEISVSGSALRVGMEEGEIVVWSAENRLLPVYRLNGTLARVVRLQPGKNILETPGSGIFIIAGKKMTL